MRSRALTEDERSAWEAAQAIWGVHMHDPQPAPSASSPRGAPAWFTFPPKIFIDPSALPAEPGIELLTSVLAHELGHHVLAPATRIDSLKIRHQLARTLLACGAPEVLAAEVSLLANLWTDLLVNFRLALLQRRTVPPEAEPGIVAACRTLYAADDGGQDPLWWVYCRTYELLWHLPPGALCREQPPATAPDLTAVPSAAAPAEAPRPQASVAELTDELRRATATEPEVDAGLLAETVRTFATDPIAGALRFGVIVAPYLVQRHDGEDRLEGPGYSPCAADEAPATAAELGQVLADRRLEEELPDHPAVGSDAGSRPPEVPQESARHGTRQRLGVAQTLLLYPAQNAEAVLAAWYRAHAARWVRPYTRAAPAPTDELPGPLTVWENGDDLADLDWPATLQRGPVVPGVTTRRRTTLTENAPSRPRELDLDLYLDSSGSMPRPRDGSPAILAGTILALSVLRGGGRVRVTSFSGPGQVAGTRRFVRSTGEILDGIQTFFGGGTTFPLDLYADRHIRPGPEHRDQHVVVLSDDGLVSMFGVGDPAREHVAAACRTRLTTATLVLMDPRHRVADLATAAGYDTIYLDTIDDSPAVCARLADTLHG